MKVTECVDKSRVEQSGEFLAFLVGKSGILAIGLRVAKVDFSMGYIEVAA